MDLKTSNDYPGNWGHEKIFPMPYQGYENKGIPLRPGVCMIKSEQRKHNLHTMEQRLLLDHLFASLDERDEIE